MRDHSRCEHQIVLPTNMQNSLAVGRSIRQYAEMSVNEHEGSSHSDGESGLLNGCTAIPSARKIALLLIPRRLCWLSEYARVSSGARLAGMRSSPTHHRELPIAVASALSRRQHGRYGTVDGHPHGICQQSRIDFGGGRFRMAQRFRNDLQTGPAKSLPRRERTS